MGSGVLQFPNLHSSHGFFFFLFNTRNTTSTNIIPSTPSSTSWPCYFFSTTKYGGGSDSDWYRTTRRRSYKQRSKYGDEFFNYDYEDEEEFGFRNSGGKKKRSWWSDDDSFGDDDEEDNIGGFGILEEEAIGFSSIFKVLGAFGWMVPAAIVTMLLGSGTNGFVMALALPLAQSALSLIFDAVWGRSANRARPKSRRRKKSAFTGKSRKERTENSQSDGYQPRESANDVSANTRERRSRSFGGWDELDKEMPKTSTTNENKQQKEGKLSRRARNRQTPLFMRLLIAAFPFLGSWTKLL